MRGTNCTRSILHALCGQKRKLGKRKSIFLRGRKKPAIRYSPHLSLIVVDGQVLPVTFDRGEGAHGDAANGVGGEKLTQLLALVALETEPHVFKCSLLGTEGGSLREERGKNIPIANLG